MKNRRDSPFISWPGKGKSPGVEAEEWWRPSAACFRRGAHCSLALCFPINPGEVAQRGAGVRGQLSGDPHMDRLSHVWSCRGCFSELMLALP